MAMLVIEGFDQYTTDAEVQRGGWVSSNFGNITPGHTAEIHGSTGKAILLTASVAMIKAGFTSSATFTAGIAMYHRNSGPQNAQIFRFIEGGSTQGELRETSSGELTYRRGTGTVVSTSSGAGLVQGAYQYIEVEVFLHASTGTVKMWVDGVEVANDTGLNTLQTSTAVIDRVDLIGNSTIDQAYDDLYLLDDSGSDNTSQLGPCFVETIVPDADGVTNNFTRVGGGSNNYEAVDDIAPPDDDTTYNHSATATDVEMYGMAALTSAIGTVFAVEASALVRKEDPGFREIQVRARNNVTDVDSPSKGFSVEYRYIGHIFENDPDGGGNWTETDVNSAQFGIVLET